MVRAAGAMKEGLMKQTDFSMLLATTFMSAE